MPGVIAKYKLTGSDQTKATSINARMKHKAETAAKQAGTTSIANVLHVASGSVFPA